MSTDLEIRYRKFFIDAGQQLVDLPAYHRLKKHGWQVSWSYRQEGADGPYIETLLQRSLAKQMQEPVR